MASQKQADSGKSSDSARTLDSLSKTLMTTITAQAGPAQWGDKRCDRYEPKPVSSRIIIIKGSNFFINLYFYIYKNYKYNK